MNKTDCFVMTAHGWRHRPAFKVVANTILRAIQAWSDSPLLVVSVTTDPKDGERPVLIGYRMGRIQMSPR